MWELNGEGGRGEKGGPYDYERMKVYKLNPSTRNVCKTSGMQFTKSI